MVCLAVLLNILLDICTVPAYGAYGAAAATVISEAALALMNMFCHPAIRISKPVFLRTAAACICCLIIHSALPDIPAVRIAADAVIWTGAALWIIQTKEIQGILKRIREDYGTE